MINNEILSILRLAGIVISCIVVAVIVLLLIFKIFIKLKSIWNHHRRGNIWHEQYLTGPQIWVDYYNVIKGLSFTYKLLYGFVFRLYINIVSLIISIKKWKRLVIGKALDNIYYQACPICNSVSVGEALCQCGAFIDVQPIKYGFNEVVCSACGTVYLAEKNPKDSNSFCNVYCVNCFKVKTRWRGNGVAASEY